MNNIDPGYKFSAEVLLNLNHDRYKSYFTQFIVLHFGIFTVYNSDNLEHLTCGFSVVGIILAFVWFRVLWVIIADIRKLWELIRKYENESDQDKGQNRKPVKTIKINESRDSLVRKKRGDAIPNPFLKRLHKVLEIGSGKLMLSVPILFIIIHGYIFFKHPFSEQVKEPSVQKIAREAAAKQVSILMEKHIQPELGKFRKEIETKIQDVNEFVSRIN